MLADLLGMSWAIASIGVLTFGSGIVVARVMYEMLPSRQSAANATPAAPPYHQLDEELRQKVLAAIVSALDPLDAMRAIAALGLGRGDSVEEVRAWREKTWGNLSAREVSEEAARWWREHAGERGRPPAKRD